MKKGKEVDKGNKSPAGDVGLQAPSTVKATRELEKLPLSSVPEPHLSWNSQEQGPQTQVEIPALELPGSIAFAKFQNKMLG